MAKLIEYTATSDQIKALNNALKFSNNGVFLRLKDGNHKIVKSHLYAYDFTHYLICQPHPHAAIIKIWADTGCEVYVCEHHNNYYEGILESADCFYHSPTNKPNWNIPNAEYRLTPFED